MKRKFHKIKRKIMFCVMSVAILLSVLITVIMSAGNIFTCSYGCQ